MHGKYLFLSAFCCSWGGGKGPGKVFMIRTILCSSRSSVPVQNSWQFSVVFLNIWGSKEDAS